MNVLNACKVRTTLRAVNRRFRTPHSYNNIIYTDTESVVETCTLAGDDIITILLLLLQTRTDGRTDGAWCPSSGARAGFMCRADLAKRGRIKTMSPRTRIAARFSLFFVSFIFEFYRANNYYNTTRPHRSATYRYDQYELYR